jgi:hypothetical protein
MAGGQIASATLVLISQMSTSPKDATLYNKASYSRKTDLVLIWARHSAWLFFTTDIVTGVSAVV